MRLIARSVTRHQNKQQPTTCDQSQVAGRGYFHSIIHWLGKTNPMTSIKDVDSHCKSPISKGLVCVADIKFPLPYMPKSFSHMLWIISHTT
ncbi:hypothetical protein YC2023_093963 [Brassica napus]